MQNEFGFFSISGKDLHPVDFQSDHHCFHIASSFLRSFLYTGSVLCYNLPAPWQLQFDPLLSAGIHSSFKWEKHDEMEW